MSKWSTRFALFFRCIWYFSVEVLCAWHCVSECMYVSVCKIVLQSSLICGQIEKSSPSFHPVIPRPQPNQTPRPKPPACCFCEQVCMCACVWVCGCTCWWWKIPGANVGVDYPPPLPLWSAANGTNCTVLSLMHCELSPFLYSSPECCSNTLPSPTTRIQSACNMLKQCVTQWLDSVS